MFLQSKMTALHWAGMQGFSDIVTFLLNHGARVDDVDGVSL